jgi:hypothetical protein
MGEIKRQEYAKRLEFMAFVFTGLIGIVLLLIILVSSLEHEVVRFRIVRFSD